MQRKKKIPVPVVVVMVLCIALLGFSLCQLVGIFLEYRQGTDEYDELRQYVRAELPDAGLSDGEEFPDEEKAPGDAESSGGTKPPDGEPSGGAENSDGGENFGGAENSSGGENSGGEASGTENKPAESEGGQRIAFSELKAQNPDTVAWIEIPDTKISYPVMHTIDNDYYLNHTFSGKTNKAGSIFVETLNAPDFSDVHTVIYGHNMKNGTMFGGLKEYRSASYLAKHPVIYLDMEDGTHAYQIFSCYETGVDSDSYTIGFVQDAVYEEFLKTIKERSAYDTGVDVSVGDYIITLSTCTGNDATRFLVHAKKIE